MEYTFTEENFETEVEKSSLPVLVDFWATWCGPCKMMSPVVEELASELEGKVKVGKVNVDDEEELARKFGIMSIPTFIRFKDGKQEAMVIGGQSKDALKAFALGL